MTEQEKQLKIAEIDAEIARRTGDKKALADATNRIFQLQSPVKSGPISTSPSAIEPTSARLARTGQAVGDVLGSAKPKAASRTSPDTGATSLVTNKIDPKAKPLPSAVKRAQMERGQAARRSTRSGDVKAYESRTTGKPSAGDVRAYEATQRPARPVESTAEKFAKDLAMYLNPSADTSRTGTLANLLSSGVQTLPGLGGSPESLQRFGKSTEGLAGKIVGENYDPTDPESALLTALSGVGPAAGGQFAMGAVSKVLPRTLNPLLAGGAKLGSAIAGGAGTGYVQGKGTEAIANAIGQGEAYQQKQQQVADFQSRHALLSTLLQSGGTMAMQRPSLGATMGERGAGLGLGLATSVGGDIVGNQPIDWQKAVNEAIANAVTAGPNTKLGTAVENAGAKAVSPLVPKVRQAPKNLTGTPALYRQGEVAPSSVPPEVSFVNPNAPVESPVKPVVPKTSAQAPSKPKVTEPMGEAGTIAPESLIFTAPTTRKGKVTETAPPVETPPVQEPVKKTGDLLTRPAEPVKETPKSIQVEEPTPEIPKKPWEKTKQEYMSGIPETRRMVAGEQPLSQRIAFEVKTEGVTYKHPSDKRITINANKDDEDGNKVWVSWGNSVSLLSKGENLYSVLSKFANEYESNTGNTATVYHNGLGSVYIGKDYAKWLGLKPGVNTLPAPKVKTVKDVILHDDIVEQALKRGDEVPQNVLKEYPELALKYGKAIYADPTPTLQAEPKLETAEPTAPKTEPLTPARRTILARDVQSALADVNAPDKATSEAARTRLATALDTLRADGAIKGEGVKLTDAITDRESFRKSVQEAFNLPDDQADEVANLVDDWANGWAKKNDATPADFYATVKGIHSFDDDLAQLVLGTGAKTAKGARLPQEGVITALKRGDVSTAVHEMAHHFLDTLPETARKKVMDSFPGATKENAHELFAKGFEAGLKDPNSPLHRYYTKFKSWLDDVYGKSIAQWRKATGYVEGGLRVQEDRNGKKVVSFVTGLPKDANDIVMDYINTGRNVKGFLDSVIPIEIKTKTSGTLGKDAVDIVTSTIKELDNDFPEIRGHIPKIVFTDINGGSHDPFTAELRFGLFNMDKPSDQISKMFDEGTGTVKGGFKATIIHEFAHALDGYIKKHGSQETKDAWYDQKSALRSAEGDRSAYASKNLNEWLAEHVAYDYMNGNKDTAVVRLLREYLGKARADAGLPKIDTAPKASEPQFQQADDDTTTIFDVPLKNAAIQGFFDVDPETLQLKTTVKAEMKSALELAQTPGFAEKVIKQVLNGENILTPKFTAQNIVVAAEASKRRAKWESLKNSDAPQSEVDKAYDDYMKMVNASYLLGREPGMALRMRQEMVATADPLDPDSYISKAAGMYTGNLNDPEFKAFVERVTAKSATARQSHDSLMSEVDRLSKAYDESQAALAQANTDKSTLEAEKKKIEDQLFSKKPPKTPSKPKEAPSTVSGTTAPKTASSLPEKTRQTGYQRGTTKLKTESSDEAISASKKRALSGLDRLKALARSKKFQFQQDDDIADIDDDVSGSISEGRQALIDIGQGLLASGTRNFKTWKEEISGFLGEAGIDDLEDHQYQVLWVDSKIALRDEVPDMNTGVKKSSIAGTTIQKVIGSLSLEGAQSWLDNISDTDGNPVIFEKLVKGQDLTPAELDVAARAWMVVQKAQGQRVSNRGKVGAIEDIKRVAREIKAQETKAAKQTVYAPLTSEQGAEIVRKALARVRTAAQEKKASDPIKKAASEVLASVRRLQANSVNHQSPDVVNGIVDKALGQFESGSVDDAKATLKQALADVALLRKQARMAKTQAKGTAPFDQAKAEERIRKAITGLTENAKSRPAVDPLKRSTGEVVAAITRTKTALEGKAPISEVVDASEQALALYKSGDLEGAKKVLADLRAKYPTARTDITMDAALESISKMTEALGKDKANTESPVMRARLARFNGAVKALAKRYIGDGQGQLTATEFKALVDDAIKQFEDAGTDVEKHQQVLRDLRSSTLRGVGLDPNVRYQFSQYKTDADAMDAVKANIDNEGQGLAGIVRDYIAGRVESKPNPLLDLATVEYAKAGGSLTAWAKSVENRWGKTLDRDKLDALYDMAQQRFLTMKPDGGVSYAVQMRRIREQMQYELQKVAYDQLSPADKLKDTAAEMAMALTGNVASFDYSFAGRQAGTALILSPDLYAKALLAGVKATGIGKVSPEEQALIFDNASSNFFNEKFGSSDYYKKALLEITDDAFSDIYTHHGLTTPNAIALSDALSTVGAKPLMKLGAKALDKAGSTQGAEKLRQRADSMVGPGQRSEAMNRMFIKQLRFDLFRRATKNGEVYKGLLDALEKATTEEEKSAIQKKLTYQDEYNKMVGKLISITTGKAAVERPAVRSMLTTMGRVGIWSPSFWLSRAQAMTAYPAWDVLFGKNELHAIDRMKIAALPLAVQQAEIQAFNLVLFLLSRIPGVQIMGTDDDEVDSRKTVWNWSGSDPMNTDFGKVKYEGQEYDLSAGIRKHLVFANRAHELMAQGYEDWWRAGKGRLPNETEYDPFFDSKVTTEDGKRQLIQYIKSSTNPVASTIYDITRGGAKDALGRQMSPLDTAMRLLVPIPIANVIYSAGRDRAEEKRQAESVGDYSLMERVKNNENTFLRDTIMTGTADLLGVSSGVRDRELEDTIKQSKKHSGWMSKGYIPSKQDDELRNQITKLIKDSVALSGASKNFPSKKEVDVQARAILKTLPLARLDRQTLISLKRDLAKQVSSRKKVVRYLKTESAMK